MVWCAMFHNGDKILKSFLIEVTQQILWMAQYPGVRPAMSTHRCTWDGRRLPTLCSLLNPLDPTKTPWRPKAQDNIPPEHPKGIFAFRLSCPEGCLGSCPKGPSPRTSSWPSHWMKVPRRHHTWITYILKMEMWKHVQTHLKRQNRRHSSWLDEIWDETSHQLVVLISFSYKHTPSNCHAHLLKKIHLRNICPP